MAERIRSGLGKVSGSTRKEMTSEDVVRPRRWGKQAPYGKALFAQVADLKAVNRYTVELTLKEQSAIVIISLAIPNNFAAIYPKEIAEKFAPNIKATEYVGTGPFKLAEWLPDQYIRMVRFDDYRGRNERPSGYGGGKTVYIDEVRWIPVPDVTTRVAQIETGELDLADDLNLDAYDRLTRNPNIRPLIVKPYYWPSAVFNKKEGLMANPKLRQAWQAALDIEPIMKNVAGGKPEFYRMDSSLAFAEITEWHTKIPGLPWNERNREKAKAAAAGGRIQGRADSLSWQPRSTSSCTTRRCSRSSSSRTLASTSTCRSSIGRRWSSGETTRRSGDNSPARWRPFSTRPKSST